MIAAFASHRTGRILVIASVCLIGVNAGCGPSGGGPPRDSVRDSLRDSVAESVSAAAPATQASRPTLTSRLISTMERAAAVIVARKISKQYDGTFQHYSREYFG